jgi:hypothetical protein
METTKIDTTNNNDSFKNLDDLTIPQDISLVTEILGNKIFNWAQTYNEIVSILSEWRFEVEAKCNELLEKAKPRPSNPYEQ